MINKKVIVKPMATVSTGRGSSVWVSAFTNLFRGVCVYGHMCTHTCLYIDVCVCKRVHAQVMSVATH